MVICTVISAYEVLVHCIVNFWHGLRPAFWVDHVLDHFLTANKTLSKVFETPWFTGMDFGTLWMKIVAIVFIVRVVALTGSRLSMERQTSIQASIARGVLLTWQYWWLVPLRNLFFFSKNLNVFTIQAIVLTWQETIVDLLLCWWKQQEK